MTDKEFIDSIKDISTEELFEQLEWYRCDPYYADLWRAVICELKRRMGVKKKMKLVIDVPNQIIDMVCNTGTYGCYRFNSTKAIKNGVPLDKVLEDIKADIEHDKNVATKDYVLGLTLALRIIDKHIGGENK